MEISIKEIEDSIKKVFTDADVLNTDSVYEKINGTDDLKLVIFINKLFDVEVSVLYTKLIFVVDGSKKKLKNNSFLYLYDINCKYTSVEFSDTTDFEKKLKSIIENKKFGRDLKALSRFIESPAMMINEWLKENRINEINILNVKYNPKMYIMPCKSLSFSFVINANNVDINFSITKENNENYEFSFIINGETVTESKPNLKTLVPTIGTILKNKLK